MIVDGAARRFGCFAISLFVPGAGHCLIGRPVRGALWCATRLLAVPLFVPFPLLLGLLMPFCITALTLAAAIDSARLEPRPRRLGVAIALALLLAGGQWQARNVVKSQLLEAFSLPTASMVPTILAGDHLFVRRAVHDRPLERGDVAAFVTKAGKLFVKRVIGLPGETITWQGNRFAVDGRELGVTAGSGACSYETAIDGETRGCQPMVESDGGRSWNIVYDEGAPAAGDEGAPAARDGGPVKLGAKQYFFVGDNRDNSRDSRQIGAVDADMIFGRALTIWYSRGGKSGVRFARAGTIIR